MPRRVIGLHLKKHLVALMANFINDFIKERNAALLSLNKGRIEAFAKKWNAEFPYSTESVFWAAVHKARLCIVVLPQEAKDLSRTWLLENGFGLPPE